MLFPAHNRIGQAGRYLFVQQILFFTFVLAEAPKKPPEANHDTAALYYAQLFNRKEHCKGPFVWSCEDCGLAIYDLRETNVSSKCVKVLVREKAGAAEKRADNGRFSFDKVVSPPPAWQKYDGFEIRLLKFIAEYEKFFIAFYHWEDHASATDEAENLDDSVNASTAKVDPDAVAKRVVISLISRGEFHLGSGSFTMGQQLNNSPVDYSEGFFSMQVVLIQRLPPASKEVESIPFEPKILFIAVGTLLVVTLVWNRIKSLIARQEERNPRNEGSFAYRLVSDLLEMFSSIFDQDMLSAQSGRKMILAGWIILMFWWVYLIIFKSLYTALMTSKMSVSYRIAPVAGLEQLASRSDLVPIVMRDSVLKDWLEEKRDQPVYQDIWRKLNSNTSAIPLITDLSYDAIFNVLKKDVTNSYVLLTTMKASFVYGKDMMCEAHTSKINYWFWKAFPLPPNATHFKRAMIDGIRKALYIGLLDKLVQDFGTVQHYCSTNGNDFGTTDLSIVNLDNTFMYFGYALIIAFICFILEVLSKACARRRHR